MSFSFMISGTAADEARASIKAASEYNVPPCLRDFILLGINGLKERHGASVPVEVMVRGHLCHDGQSYDVSEAFITVRKYEAPRMVDEGAKVAPQILGEEPATTEPADHKLVSAPIGSGGLGSTVEMETAELAAIGEAHKTE